VSSWLDAGVGYRGHMQQGGFYRRNEGSDAPKKNARQGRQSGKKRALTRTKTKFSWRRNIQVGPFLVTLALLRRVDRE
jgi:hypothetical protein